MLLFFVFIVSFNYKYCCFYMYVYHQIWYIKDNNRIIHLTVNSLYIFLNKILTGSSSVRFTLYLCYHIYLSGISYSRLFFKFIFDVHIHVIYYIYTEFLYPREHLACLPTNLMEIVSLMLECMA